MKSIIQTEKECYVCKTTRGLHLHHVFYGHANRKISDDHGFVVWLCGEHHNLSKNGVHFNTALDETIKKDMQKEYEKKHTRDEFMELIGRNYLE